MNRSGPVLLSLSRLRENEMQFINNQYIMKTNQKQAIPQPAALLLSIARL